MIDRSEHLWKVYGSVLPRSLIWGVLGAIEGGLLDSSGWRLFTYRVGPEGSALDELWHHPYTVNIIGMVIGYVLVMRVQVAYQRFWEGVTQLMQCTSKMGDVALQLMTFDEVRAGGGRPVFDEPAFEFRMQILHFCSLFHAVALVDCRGDQEEDTQGPVLTLNREDPYLFRLHLTTEQDVLRESSCQNTLLDKDGAREASPYLRRISGCPFSKRLSSANGIGGTCAMRESAHGAMQDAVPLQQVLAARRTLSQQVGVAVDANGRPSRCGAGCDASAFNCISAVESAELGVQPVSVQQFMHRRPGTERSSSGREVTRWSSRTDGLRRSAPLAVESKQLRNGGVPDSSTLRPPTASPLAPPPLRRTTTGLGGAPRRERGTSMCEYVWATILLRPSKMTLNKLARANCFDVVGGVSEVEVGLLSSVPPADRSYLVMTWIYRVVAARLGEGGLGIPAPLLSRTYQVCTVAMRARARRRCRAHERVCAPHP